MKSENPVCEEVIHAGSGKRYFRIVRYVEVPMSHDRETPEEAWSEVNDETKANRNGQAAGHSR